MCENPKSLVSIMLNLNKSLLEDLHDLHGVQKKELSRDYSTMERRSHSEGPSFFTKTLPKLAKSIDFALLGNQLNISSFKLRRGTKLPLFLNGLFKLVFSEDGYVLERPCKLAIRSLRQVGFSFYKLELPYGEAALKKSICELKKHNSTHAINWHSMDTQSILYYAKEVINEIFNNFTITDRAPKNGPGAVANGKKTWERFKPHTYYEELDNLVPYSVFFYYNDRHLFDEFDTLFELPYSSESCTVFEAVPKDSRAPRVISKEPPEKMAYQKKLQMDLYPYLEYQCPLTRGHINFTDQKINGSLALQASLHLDRATIDMKRASDCVLVDHVDYLFEDTCLHEYLMKSRSSHMIFPDQSKVLLNIYAPMGNALTFPVEAVTFYAVCVGALMQEGLGLKHACSLVYVYGDDIIIPNHWATHIMSALEYAGFLVNKDKSCFSGIFRESCGVDAVLGTDVTPTRFKKILDPKVITSVIAYFSQSDDLFQKGYWRLSRKILDLIDPKGRYPWVSEGSPLIGPCTWNNTFARRLNQRRMRWSKTLHDWTLKGITISPRTVRPSYSGWQHCLNVAWNFIGNKEPYSTNNFTVRYAVIPKHTVVVGHAI